MFKSKSLFILFIAIFALQITVTFGAAPIAASKLEVAAAPIAASKFDADAPKLGDDQNQQNPPADKPKNQSTSEPNDQPAEKPKDELNEQPKDQPVAKSAGSTPNSGSETSPETMADELKRLSDILNKTLAQYKKDRDAFFGESSDIDKSLNKHFETNEAQMTILDVVGIVVAALIILGVLVVVVYGGVRLVVAQRTLDPERIPVAGENVPRYSSETAP